MIAGLILPLVLLACAAALGVWQYRWHQQRRRDVESGAMAPASHRTRNRRVTIGICLILASIALLVFTHL